MSRASLTADVISPRSSHNHRSENDSNNGSLGVLTFPRRLPRLGHTYQLNGLPDRTDLYVPERPSPLLLSEIAPWRTHEEVQRSKEPQQQQNDDTEVPVHDSTELNGSTLGSSPWSFPSTSGSSKVKMGHEQLSTCTTTGDVSSLGVQQLPIVMQDWLQQIVIWHSTKLSLDESSSSGRQQQRRKAKKRPRSPTDEELPPLPKRAASVAATTTVLQHHWTGGRAHAAKRAASNDRVSDWRNPLPTAILGDFRDSRHSYLTSATEETADGNSVGHDVDPETMWNAVLACSQTLEELLLSCRSEVYVSQLVTVLECARRLPHPEHVFNAMDGGHTAEAINASLNHLDGVVQNARSYQAYLSDKLFSKRKEIINEGVDVVAGKDLIHRASEVLAPVVIDETEEWLKQIDQVLNWQKRVEKTDVRNRNQLAVLQQLAAEAAAQHRFISTFVLQLRAKLEQANELTERVESWRREERTESVKWLTSLVRDVERLEIQLPAAEYLLQVHADANTWLERADVAIRSRLSLQQVQELLETVVPGIELTDWCEKLKTRVTSAETWLAAVGQFVPDPNPSLAWMNAVRHALEDADIAIDLHDLACEGGRLSVQVPEAQLLQAEVEARSWSSKAEKWIPSTSSSQPKKPKLDELKDHMAKTAGLRDLLVVLPNEEDRREWVLPGEDELKNLVKQAEEWLITFNSVGQEEGKYVSLSDLREIERNGQAICVNLVPSTTKVSKVLTQAEAWYGEYSHLWTRCFSDPADATGFLQVSELQAAVEAAESSLQIDLQEAVDLERVLARIAEWQKSVNFVTGQVSRRHRKLVFTVDDLTRLLKEAPLLPINTNEHVESLLNELETVRSWQAEAATLLREIDAGLQSARQALCEMYGAPSMYARLGQSNENGELAKDVNAAETDAFLLVWNSDPFVQKSIDMYCASTENIHVDTPESEFSAVLSAAAKWCSRSVKYLESQTDIFDTRFFGAFDRFTLEGKKLMMCNDRMEIDRPTRIESAELQQLKSTMESLVGDQMQRLGVILRDRERFKCWCSVAEALVFGGDKKPSLEKLQELSRESQDFPGVDDTVRRIRKLADDATHWALQARDAMATETRLTYAEAKSLCSEGENLGVQCSELAQLRRALKAARSWASRASRSKADQGSIHAKDLQDLIEEHDTLLVSLPEELSKLRQAAKNYCICRRPYEGFMVECDVCGDWFHGPCIGVSEAKANKVDKYTCVRCNLARTYRGSAGVVAGVIRKWTNEKELKKARQVSAQKHQRKVRKETKMIQKLLEEESILLQEKLVLERLCSEEKKNVECEVPSEDASSSEGPVPSNIAHGEDKKDAVTHLTHKEVDVPGNESDQSPEGASETNPCVRISVIASRLQKIVEEIQLCNDRLVELDKELKEKESAEGVEDMCAAVLKRWCIRVRSLVLVPSTIEQAQNCKPNADGSMSAAMKSVLEEAGQRGLSIFEDVHCISNAFSCMGWALRATAILGRQPHYDEVKGLVQQAALLTLPDEKGLRMLKGMAQRARSWNRKVAKTLTPIPGESSPFDVEYLRDLANAGDDIPLRLPLESRVHAVIEDKGARHCLCGGPSDGRFMLGCDACEKWFHGHCVGIKSNHTPNDIEEWKCPLCTDFVASDLDLHVGKFHDNFDVVSESEDEDISLSSRAPQPGELWPPFGLTVSSDKAVEALGKKCCAIPDSDGDWMPGEHAAFVSIDCQVVTRNHVDALLVNNETQAAETSGDARSEFGDSFSVKVVSEASFSSARSTQCPPGRPKADSEQALKPSPGTYREPDNASCTAGLSVSVHVPKRTALLDEYVNSSEDNLLHCKVPAKVSVHNSIGGTSIVSTTENFQDLEKLHREVLVAPVAESSCE